MSGNGEHDKGAEDAGPQHPDWAIVERARDGIGYVLVFQPVPERPSGPDSKPAPAVWAGIEMGHVTDFHAPAPGPGEEIKVV